MSFGNQQVGMNASAQKPPRHVHHSKQAPSTPPRADESEENLEAIDTEQSGPSMPAATVPLAAQTRPKRFKKGSLISEKLYKDFFVRKKSKEKLIK
jgi:hypothetical protein